MRILAAFLAALTLLPSYASAAALAQFRPARIINYDLYGAPTALTFAKPCDAVSARLIISDFPLVGPNAPGNGPAKLALVILQSDGPVCAAADTIETVRFDRPIPTGFFRLVTLNSSGAFVEVPPK